jgi:hypothetical protein
MYLLPVGIQTIHVKAMKTLLTVLMPFFLLPCISAQEIDHQLYQKTWLDNQVREFNGFYVTKVFGHNPHWPSAYNVLPITAISYKSLEDKKREIRQQAEDEKWSDGELIDVLRDLEFSASGGELQIYISRYNEEDANFRWFFVILRGEDDKGKIWEHEIGYQAPEVPYERGWWNYKELKIPVDVDLPFYVYFNDKQSKYLSDFKFKVERVVEP